MVRVVSEKQEVLFKLLVADYFRHWWNYSRLSPCRHPYYYGHLATTNKSQLPTENFTDFNWNSSRHYGFLLLRITDAHSILTEQFHRIPYDKADILITSLGLFFVRCQHQSFYHRIIHELSNFESLWWMLLVDHRISSLFPSSLNNSD